MLASIATGEGPGFPSGHAFGSTLVWDGFALVIFEDELSPGWIGAVAVVGLVSLSRLVLDAHYFVDVVVGIGLGAIVLGILYAVVDRGISSSTPRRSCCQRGEIDSRSHLRERVRARQWRWRVARLARHR